MGKTTAASKGRSQDHGQAMTRTVAPVPTGKGRRCPAGPAYIDNANVGPDALTRSYPAVNG